MSDERVQYDGTELDEIVAEGVTVHIEGLDAHHFMIRIYRSAVWNPEGVLTRTAVNVHLSGADLIGSTAAAGLPVINRPAVVYCHEWNDRSGRAHKCYERTEKHARHKCSCGATTRRAS